MKTIHLKHSSYFKILALAIGALSFAGPAHAHGAESGKVTPLLTKALPDIAGKEVTMITVDYAPGASDQAHRHNANVFVYVLEGSIVMQMKGGKEVTLNPGDTFYEDPNGVHEVGRNASDTKPAKFLVFFVKDKDAPILIPEKEEKPADKK